jgi:hypothetical protein
VRVGVGFRRDVFVFLPREPPRVRALPPRPPAEERVERPDPPERDDPPDRERDVEREP